MQPSSLSAVLPRGWSVGALLLALSSAAWADWEHAVDKLVQDVLLAGLGALAILTIALSSAKRGRLSTALMLWAVVLQAVPVG